MFTLWSFVDGFVIIGTMKKYLAMTMVLVSSILSSFGGQLDADAELVASRHKGFVVVVKGSSMVPMFRNNDLLVVIPTNVSDLKIGQIAVYKNSLGELVAHRVESVRPLVLKGLSNKVTDKDSLVELRGTVYGTVNNWLDEEVTTKVTVLAKKY